MIFQLRAGAYTVPDLFGRWTVLSWSILFFPQLISFSMDTTDILSLGQRLFYVFLAGVFLPKINPYNPIFSPLPFRPIPLLPICSIILFHLVLFCLASLFFISPISLDRLLLYSFSLTQGIFLFCFLSGATSDGIHAYSWLCINRSLLMLGVITGSAVCKTSAVPTVL